jgi:uncharacterized protein YcbX
VWTCVVAAIIMYLLTMRREKKRLVGYVSGLRTHPVKSCRAVKVDNIEVNKLGILHDRQFVLVNEHGTFMTLRKHPRFVLIEPRVESDCILLEAPGMAPLKLPLHMKQQDGDHCSDVTVFRITMPGAVHVSDEADDWFSKYFGMEGCKLYSYPIDGTPRYAVDKGVKVDNYRNDQDCLMFGDGCPLLILSNPSVHALNKMIEETVTADRFRPNILVSKCNPFAEERWGLIEINDVRLQALYPSSRCVAINVDPITGVVNEKILEELNKVRPADGTYPKITGCCFGMNYGVRRTGTIKIGDPIYAINT